MTPIKSLPSPRLLALAACLALSCSAWAQEVSAVSLSSVPPDLIEAEPAPGVAVEHVDLGQELSDAGSSPMTMPVTAAQPRGTAARAAMAARGQHKAAVANRTRRPPPTAAQLRAGVERAVFERQPVAVPLPVGRERLITLPAPAALHVPSDIAQVARIEMIDRTIYATALVPFTTIRIVAELIDSGQQVPMDLVAGDSTAGATAELEVFVVEPGVPATPMAGAPAAALAEASEAEPQAPAVDMVELTRHAARQLYAPRRLAWASQGVQQVDVSTAAIPGLIRGVHVDTVPVGQWRSGQLYVTAIRVTNRSSRAIEVPLEDIRGRWLAATAQHGRLGPAGSETDTTAVYLVCDRAFTACLN